MIRKTQQLSEPRMRVSYLECGHGPVLVLIHGVGMNADVWYPQFEALSDTYRVIAVDLPGHGESEGFGYAASLTDYVEWLSAFLATLPEPRFAIAGHSMGALITSGLAIDHPQLVSHAIVMSGVYRRNDDARRSVLQRASELARGEAQLDSPLSRWFSNEPEEAEIRERVKGWLSDVDLQGYATAYQAFANGDRVYADRWGEIRCPVLVLTGELDANSSPEMANGMAAAAPLGQSVIINGAKHMVSLTDAPRVNEEIVQFLQYSPGMQSNDSSLTGAQLCK